MFLRGQSGSKEMCRWIVLVLRLAVLQEWVLPYLQIWRSTPDKRLEGEMKLYPCKHCGNSHYSVQLIGEKAVYICKECHKWYVLIDHRLFEIPFTPRRN